MGNRGKNDFSVSWLGGKAHQKAAAVIEEEGRVTEIRELPPQARHVSPALRLCLGPKLVEQIRFLGYLGLIKCVRLEIVSFQNLSMKTLGFWSALSRRHNRNSQESKNPAQLRGSHNLLNFG